MGCSPDCTGLVNDQSTEKINDVPKNNHKKGFTVVRYVVILWWKVVFLAKFPIANSIIKTVNNEEHYRYTYWKTQKSPP